MPYRTVAASKIGDEFEYYGLLFEVVAGKHDPTSLMCYRDGAKCGSLCDMHSGGDCLKSDPECLIFDCGGSPVVAKYKWQTVDEWEAANGEYPHWAMVFWYDNYGEHWEARQWSDLKPLLPQLRKEKRESWTDYREPVVANALHRRFPEWREAGTKLLKRDADSLA